jgi:hypothetical protein
MLVLSIKSECLNKLIPIGQNHLRRAVREFVEHYHLERNHQGLDNALIDAAPSAANDNFPVECRERLGGLLNCSNAALSLLAEGRMIKRVYLDGRWWQIKFSADLSGSHHRGRS